MTRMILEIKENSDVKIFKEIADRLELPYTIEDLVPTDIPQEKIQRIMQGIDVSNFGEPTDWQRETRKDRNFNTSII